jgi:hypothetical protein
LQSAKSDSKTTLSDFAPLVALANLYVQNKELVLHGKYRGTDAAHALYRQVIHFISSRFGEPETCQRAIRYPVLAYARWLKSQRLFPAMFKQYYRISQPPKADWTAVYKTGKYLLMPTRHECIPNEKVGKIHLKRATEKGFAKAPFILGWYEIEEKNKNLDEGLDSLFLSYQMGYFPALVKFIETTRLLGGPRRNARQHFLHLVDSHRVMTQELRDSAGDKRKIQKLAVYMATCIELLEGRAFLKYQWEEGMRRIAISTVDAKFFLSMARKNGHRDAEPLFGPRQTNFPGHRCPTDAHFGPFRDCRCCDACYSRRSEVPKMRCSECYFDVCAICAGGIWADDDN